MNTTQKFVAALLLLLPQMSQLQTAVSWEHEMAALAASRTLWNSHNFKSYSFHSEKTCFGCDRYFPALVSVELGSVVAAVHPETTTPIDIGTALAIPGYSHNLDAVYDTIDELFVVVEQALKNRWGTSHAGPKASSFSVVYDDAYGFPISISVDYSRGLDASGSEYRATDSRYAYHVSKFTAAP